MEEIIQTHIPVSGIYSLDCDYCGREDGLRFEEYVDGSGDCYHCRKCGWEAVLDEDGDLVEDDGDPMWAEEVWAKVLGVEEEG